MSTNTTPFDQEIMQFLADPTRPALRITKRDYNYLLIRSPFDDETDFLYMAYDYGAGKDPRRLDGKAEFAGVYSRPRNVIVSPCYSLSDLVLSEHVSDIRDETEAVRRRADEIVCEIAARGPVPVTDEAEPISDDEKYFTEHGCTEEARRHFMEGTFPQIAAHVRIQDSSEGMAAVLIINHPEEAAQEYARRYIVKNARLINQSLDRLPRVIMRLAQLTATPGDHHLVRAIASSIHDEKMVRLEVERDGKSLTVRIEARGLKYNGAAEYDTWNLDAPSSREYKRVFGDCRAILPGEIKRILYGANVLYERDKVSQSDALEMTPDQFAMVCGAA